MEDLEGFGCCTENKQNRAVVFRDYKRRNPKGFYFYCFQTRKWIPAKYCPFCGANVKKFAAFV